MDRREQWFKKRTAVTKEQALNFLRANDAAEQNREAHRCGKRNSNGITQPSGAATPRNSDAHKRIAVPKAQFVEKPIPFIKLQPDFVQERGKRLGKADR